MNANERECVPQGLTRELWTMDRLDVEVMA
jgi:hypothetical protein